MPQRVVNEPLSPMERIETMPPRTSSLDPFDHVQRGAEIIVATSSQSTTRHRWYPTAV
jgi:hypothetical protein